MVGIVKVDTLQNNAGTSSVGMDYVINGSAKAWNNTNSAGTAINDSFNISSLTDHGVGRQKHNVTNSFNNANHVPTFSINANYNQQWTWDMATSKWATANYDGSNYQDAAVRTLSHGDLA